MAMQVITGFRFIGAPAVSPDPRRTQHLAARAKNDSNRFVVEQLRQTGHEIRHTLYVVGRTVYNQQSKRLARSATA